MSFLGPAAVAASQLIGDVAAPYVLLLSADRSIGGIVPDVTIREVLIDEWAITQHPVESGTPISDHYYAQPKLAELTIGASDANGGFVGYYALFYQAFQALAATRQPFDFFTDARVYPHMMIANLTKTADDTTDQTAMLIVRLQEAIITDTDGVPQSGVRSDVGQQALQPWGGGAPLGQIP